MRVLHVSPYFAPAFGFGGPPRSILALCRAQQAAGIDVEVFTTTANPSRALAEGPAGRLYDGVRARYFPLRGAAQLFWAPQLGSALSRAAREADVIHIHGLFNAPAWQAQRVARRACRPLIVSVRGMLEPAARAHHAWRKHAAWALFDRRVCRDAALFHTTSARESESVRSMLPRANITEIPNAIDVAPDQVTSADRGAIRHRLNLSPQMPFVLSLGRLHPIKRLDLAAAAFARVARLRADVRLVIAGDGDPRVRSAAEIALGDARSRAVWAGEVTDRERDALLSEASALVLCSDSENFGMSVAEALAFGVPPVVTRTCPWSVIEREAAGFWVLQTAEAIADALSRVLSNPREAAAMGERGRRIVAERFHPAVVGAAWADVYARLPARTAC